MARVDGTCSTATRYLHIHNSCFLSVLPLSLLPLTLLLLTLLPLVSHSPHLSFQSVIMHFTHQSSTLLLFIGAFRAHVVTPLRAQTQGLA